jgi:alpha-glucosidase
MFRQKTEKHQFCPMQPKKDSKKRNPPTPKEPINEVPPIPTPEAPDPPSVPFSERNISKRYDDMFEWIAPDELRSVRWTNGAYQFTAANGVALRVQVLTGHIVRLRYAPDGQWERDFSYAISPDFKPEKTNAALSEGKHEYTIATDHLQVVVAKNGLKVRIYDAEDRLLHEDGEGYSAQRTVMQGWNKVQLHKVCQRKTAFYGLGDKSALGANLHGRAFENWCTDAFGFGDTSDPLYRAVPFFYVVQQGLAHGIFLDNTYKTHFDFNTGDEGEMTFGADGGELNYYFIAGPTLRAVATRYHVLTGTHELPPMWALGYHQCRWSYYPESNVRMIAETFRRLHIPCDAIYLDIDYMDQYQCFTWNKAYFPDPKRLVEDLKGLDFHTVVMIDPGIKENPAYDIYKEGLENGHFVRTADGQVAKAPVWPGFCAFPDYTNPETRAWWGDCYRELYNEVGISGFWNDMNEPAVFYVNHKTLPDHAMHHYDGAPCSHRKAHNIYGQQMARASFEGFKALQPEKRPFLLARASYSGGQRYSALWTGDNFATWEHLQLANIQCQRMAISGFSFCGTDIGGFAGTPDGELYTRWLQLSVFHPLMRTHSMGHHATGDAIDQTDAPAEPIEQDGQEPWSFGERWTQIGRTAIELRYCLLPLIYTAFYQLWQKGMPMLRHLAFEDEKDPKLADQDRDFMFGEHVLVSPVVQPKLQRQLVYLPSGANWYYFWTGQQYAGEVFINTTQDQIPFFVREGGVLVTYPVRQHTAAPLEEVTLYCYFKNGKETTEWYEDDGEGYDYKKERYLLHTFQTEGDATKYTLNWVKNGAWLPKNRKMKLYLIGFPTFAKTCTVDGVEKPIKEIRLRDKSLYTITTDLDFNTIQWQE